MADKYEDRLGLTGKIKAIRNERERLRVDYFDSFEQLATYALEVSKILQKDVIEDYRGSSSIEPCFKAAHEIEGAADLLTSNTLQAIAVDFITPIDREDVVELALDLDSVVDNLERIIRHFYMYDIATIEPSAIEMCKLLDKECETLHEAMTYLRDFRKPQKLVEKAREIAALEDECDDLYMQAVRQLFTAEHDSPHIIKWRAIYTTIEECSDIIEGVFDLLKRIILKNI